MDLDTGLLRTFVVTAEENHFGRAAQRLHVTQQALSKRIGRLERQLGVRLFDRAHRRVELTAAGQRLLPAAHDAVAATDAVAAAVKPGLHTLRVDVMFEYLAPLRWVRAAVTDDPRLEVVVSSRAGHHSAVAALRRGDCDVAFGRATADPWPTDLYRRPAVLEPIGLLVSTEHQWARRDAVTMAELAGHRLSFPMDSAPEDWTTLVADLTREFGFTLQQPPTAMGFEHFLDRAARDPAAASLLGRAMPAPDSDRLRVIPLAEPTPVFAWALMWRRGVSAASLGRLLAAAQHSEHTIGPELAAEGSQVWLPDADRTWWEQQAIPTSRDFGP